MLGHRGCRLGITYPEITRMQARAIFEAALQVSKKGTPVKPEVMIPLVGHVEELRRQKKIVLDAADEVLGKSGPGVDYLVGTMIEVPRGAAHGRRDRHARLTSSPSGPTTSPRWASASSRDDAGEVPRYYIEHGILDKDPFVSLDTAGVGQLVEIGVQKGRAVKPGLKIGVCGEHGGDPSSIRFFHGVGPRLRLLLALPRPDRPARGGPGPAREARRGLKAPGGEGQGGGSMINGPRRRIGYSGFPRTSSTRSQPARSSSAPPPSSRSSWRTPSMPGRAASRVEIEAGGQRRWSGCGTTAHGMGREDARSPWSATRRPSSGISRTCSASPPTASGARRCPPSPASRTCVLRTRDDAGARRHRGGGRVHGRLVHVRDAGHPGGRRSKFGTCSAACLPAASSCAPTPPRPPMLPRPSRNWPWRVRDRVLPCGRGDAG